MEYYTAVKRGSLAICNNMNETGKIMLSEISQTEKEKYCMISLLYVESFFFKSNYRNSGFQGLGSGENGEMLVNSTNI